MNTLDFDMNQLKTLLNDTKICQDCPFRAMAVALYDDIQAIHRSRELWESGDVEKAIAC